MEDKTTIAQSFSEQERATYARYRQMGFAPEKALDMTVDVYRNKTKENVKSPITSAISATTRSVVNAIKDIPSDLAQTVRGVDDALLAGRQAQESLRREVNAGEVSPITGALSSVGQALGTGARVFGEGALGVARLPFTPAFEERTAETLAGTVAPVIESGFAQGLMQRYENLTPEGKAVVDGLLGVGAAGAELIGGGAVTRGANIARRGAVAATETAEDALRAGIAAARRTGAATSEAVGAAGETVARGTSSLRDLIGTSRIPQNVATNIEARVATNRAINELPTVAAQNAVRDGIDIADVNRLLEVQSRVDKTLARELADAAKAVDAGDINANPIEIVGRPIVARIKALDETAQTVGKELGEVAKNLGTVRRAELRPAVMARLSEAVPGIKLGRNGLLDFSETTLTSRATLDGRRAIQDAFTNATKGGSGLSAHRYRQELFEVLDGKKRAFENMTATQDKALQAIRRGLADVLDTKNDRYRELSREYAEITRPLADIRRLMRIPIQGLPDVAEDILEMNAGMLARRLTSTSMTRGQVESVLRALDEVSDAAGVAAPSTEALQTMYNVLNRYYNIAPATGFEGSTVSAIDTSIGGFIGSRVRNVAGQTPAVRQKALEDLINELLGV